MDKRLIALLVVIAIITVIGFMTKWTFRIRRSTYDGEDITEEELERIEKELEAELEKVEAEEGYEMYEDDSEDEDEDEDDDEE
jgi:hypothetical protein